MVKRKKKLGEARSKFVLLGDDIRVNIMQRQGVCARGREGREVDLLSVTNLWTTFTRDHVASLSFAGRLF